MELLQLQSPPMTTDSGNCFEQIEVWIHVNGDVLFVNFL